MVLDGLNDLMKGVEGMGMTHLLASVFPDVLLRIGVGSAWREPQDLQTRIGL